MKIILKIAITAAIIFGLSNLLPGVNIVSFNTAITTAIVLGLLQIFVRPIIIFLTLPATIISLGLFLFAINSSIILLTDYFVEGFTVSGFWTALLFSLLFTFTQTIFYKLLEKENKHEKHFFIK